MKPVRHIYVAPYPTIEPRSEKEKQGSLLSRWLSPQRRTLTMTQETKGVFLPYPLLGIMLALVMALVGGIVGLYSQLSAMNTTMILRDADYRENQQKAWSKIEQLEVYIHNDREKLATQQSDVDNLKRERRRN